MLFAIDSSGEPKPVTRIPHEGEYRRIEERLGEDLEAIRGALDARIEEDEIHTSSWIPGADWTGSVYEPIYEKACARNQEAAALAFGLILWVVIMDRPDAWSFGRYEKDDVPIEGMTYFRINAVD